MSAAKTDHQLYIFDVNLGERLDLDAVEMPRTNTDGLPVVKLTEEKKYTFDTLGFLVMPTVLAKDDIEEMRDFCYRLQQDAASIPGPHRSTIGIPVKEDNRTTQPETLHCQHGSSSCLPVIVPSPLSSW